MTKKQYFCNELNNVLSCFHDRIMSCCTGQIGPVYEEAYRGKRIDWKKFKQTKLDAFALLNEEDIEKSPCKGCFFLKEKTENDVISQQYTMLNVSHWTQCNCGCIYCARMFDSHGEITYKSGKSQYYDFVPLLKELYKQNLLNRKELVAVIQGGDISVLKEFEKMIKEFLKNGVKQIHILTNNIVYQPIIKKLMDLNKVLLFTSLDCGTPETYKKLKRVDKFNDSVKNLREYSKGRENPPIIVKYILVEHFNDNKEEIIKFFDLMSDIGIKMVEFTIDNKWALFTNLDEKPFPPHYGEMYTLFKEEAKKRGIKCSVYSKVEDIIQKYALK
ncbi:MAG: radical SAM protein [Candidatus Gastranaerophilales bacterium]|nr:radical SAM protein [Candidatus Gastranaerophilales bacterium]